MDRYPESIVSRLASLPHAGQGVDSENSNGVSVDFQCGTSISVSMAIDETTKVIEKISYKSSACGFSLAFAEYVAVFLEGRSLTDLKGDWPSECLTGFSVEVGPMQSGRMPCLVMVTDAFALALKDFRSRSLSSFEGESPLVCSCFGISEDVLEKLLTSGKASTVSDLTEMTNAGGGCGSCLMILRDMVESRLLDL
jgi:NifU-like protein